MNRLFSIIALLFCTIGLMAQIQVQAPRQVAVGDQFRLQYTVNTTDVKNFRAGNIPSDGFEVLMGPSTSTSQSVSIINGQVKQSATVTYTYILSALKNGTFTISSAHAKVNGADAESQSIKITVSGQSRQQQQQQGYGQQRQPSRTQQRPAGSRITGNDLFITVTANKKRVHEQEPILLTYKVFTQVELTQLEGKMPDLNGFHTQEIPLPQQKSLHIENVNGKQYRCVTWSQYVMYPQMTGKLEIPSITFKGIVIEENPNVDPFEAFFNGGSGYIEVKKDIIAPSVTIQVDPLPAKPADFSGGVGQFTLSANIDKKSVKAGDPVNLRIVIGGTGNLKLVKQPEIEVPKDFDKYDAKVSDKTKLTSNGITGNMIYDFLIVPRHQGKYEIPAVKLTYFDTATSSYKTLTSEKFTLDVLPGSGKTGDVADYSQKPDTDIRPIHEGSADLRTADDYFFGSSTYVIGNLLVFITFIVLLVIFRKRAMERANIAGMRGKKANSVASKRLKKAAKFMNEGKGNAFYDEVLRALWGYVADKFSMPVADLSRDNIAEQLSQRNIEQQIIDSFLEAIDECEFERYAPGDAAGNMQKTYDTAVTAITNIENVMKHAKKQKKSNSESSDNYLRTLLIIMVAAVSLMANAAEATKEKADEAYEKGNYQEAIQQYNALLKKGVDAEIYYNLGNAYYRSDYMTDAILAYERAYLLAPGNADIKHNLQIARSKTIDKMIPSERMFFAEWYDDIKNSLSVDTWATVSFISLIVSLVLFLVYLFVSQAVIQRVSFYLSSLLIVLFLIGNLFAWQQAKEAENCSGAIVRAASVTVKKTPSNQGADAFVIHEGTRVDITDSSLKGWAQIVLLDGREGWITTQTIENIKQK